MIKSFLRLWLATFLIVVASAVLLLTDREPPRGGAGSSATGPGSSGRVRSVALFQHVSQETLEEGVRGVLAGLAEAGYEEGRTIRLSRYNAEGDAATSNTIARAIIGGDAELVITLSTPSLQAVAGANRDAKRPHVFGMVSDPGVAGVGIARDDPTKHPPYMAGIGTMQPVAEIFRMARRLAPRLARVGVAWNPSESNSEAGTKIARTICKELGIELLEVDVDGSAAVREAVAALISRGAEAVWVGGDNTVLSALDAVIGPAQAAGVPVFTSIPGSRERGALFDLGADYHRVGQSVGRLAGRVLSGESPADMPILYEVPPEFWINRLALGAQTQGWSFPPEIDAKADVVVEKGGPVRRHPREQVAARAPSRIWKVGLAAYSESTILEEVIDGLRHGLKASGLVEGRDYTTTYRNAQGDIATLNALFDELNGNETDLVVSFSTPALQAALRKVDRKPVVFATVLDPIAAGAGKSDSDHRPDVTGVYLSFPYAEMVRTVREVLPRARRVGTLFTPAEVNSVVSRQRFETLLKGEGLELLSLPVNGPIEVSDAALALCQSGVDVLCQISDNLCNSSFPAIARACEMARTPLFTFSPSLVKGGAVLGVGADFAENGRETGLLVARVIRGEDPSRIPFHPTTKISRSVNLDNARRFGVSIPAEWVKTADEVVPARPARNEGRVMDCQIRRADNVAELVLVGSLDSSWSSYLSDRIDDVMRGGALEVRVDMAGVTYLSSNGIALLIRYHRQLQKIGGRVRIVADSDAISQVLRLTGVSQILGDDGSSPAPGAAAAARCEAVEREGMSLQFFPTNRGTRAEELELIGDPARLTERGYDAVDERTWMAVPGAVAFGLGALGPSFEACRGRFGEFLAVAGVAAYRPSAGPGRPDFEHAAGAFVPGVRVLYGLAFPVERAAVARFEAKGEPGSASVRLSQIAQVCLDRAGGGVVGVVLAGETDGLVGAALVRSPVGLAAGLDPFAHPEVREWLSLTPEPEHSRSTALVVGVATRAAGSALGPFVRPLLGGGAAELQGHFHAAVVPYRPLAGGAVELTTTVAHLFEPGRIETILHLLGDSRPIVGAGESTFTRGVIWYVPLAVGGGTGLP